MFFEITRKISIVAVESGDEKREGGVPLQILKI
jgi:hypothetical protein